MLRAQGRQAKQIGVAHFALEPNACFTSPDQTSGSSRGFWACLGACSCRLVTSSCCSISCSLDNHSGLLLVKHVQRWLSNMDESVLNDHGMQALILGPRDWWHTSNFIFAPPAALYAVLLVASWDPSTLSLILPGSLKEGFSGDFLMTDYGKAHHSHFNIPRELQSLMILDIAQPRGC